MGDGWFESLVLYTNVQLCQCGYVGMWVCGMSLCLGMWDGRTDGRMYRSLSLKGQRTEQSGLGIRANVGSL